MLKICLISVLSKLFQSTTLLPFFPLLVLCGLAGAACSKTHHRSYLGLGRFRFLKKFFLKGLFKGLTLTYSAAVVERGLLKTRVSY